MQRTPAGLPFGMPGIGDEMDGAMQQAPQPGRQLSISNIHPDKQKTIAAIVSPGAGFIGK